MPEVEAPLRGPRVLPRPRDLHGRHPAPTPAIVEQEPSFGELARRERTLRRSLAIADVLAVAFSLLLATTVLGKAPQWGLFLLAPLSVCIAKLFGLYDRDELLVRKTTLDDAPRLFQMATAGVLAVWLLDGSLLSDPLSKSQAIVLWASMPAFMILGRRSTRMLMSRRLEAERCLFIGDMAAYDRLAAKFEDPAIDATLVGRMSLRRVARRGQRCASQDELHELIVWTRADRVIIEPQALPPEEMLDLVRGAKGVGVRVSLLPRVHDVVGSEVVFDDLGGMTLLGVRRFGLSRSSMLVKRSFDLAGAGLATFALAPLMGLIALLIRLDNPGSAIFRQTRVGRDGQRFEIMKFRTMVADAEAQKAKLREENEVRGGLFKIADDPRITRVGRLLRKTSLDELPQLFNVLKGDMSLVGPRPLVIDEDDQIGGFDRDRLHLTPGMTGHWQIAGSSRVPLSEMVKIDYLYVAGWSLWVDLKILLRTVPYMLSRRGL